MLFFLGVNMKFILETIDLPFAKYVLYIFDNQDNLICIAMTKDVKNFYDELKHYGISEQEFDQLIKTGMLVK